MSKIYKLRTDYIYQQKIETLQKQLPDFCGLYIDATIRTKSRRTVYCYLLRLNAFLRLLCDTHEHFVGKDIKSLNLDDMNVITLKDANTFLAFVYSHQSDNYDKQNSNNTVELYASSLNAIFGYLYKNGYITANPFSAVERHHEKIDKPLYLEDDENVTFYDNILAGTGLTKKQLETRNKHNTAYRDYVICRLLGTCGLRVSELVGVDLEDINFEKQRIKIIRKGNKPQTIYLSDRMTEELNEYIHNVRPSYNPEAGEPAAFLVAQGKYKGQRLDIKSIENLVKKYAKAQGLPESFRFTPHKLRHTYGMNVLRKSGNLRLTQQLLGHENISTTTIYSRMLEADLEKAKDLGENEQAQKKERINNTYTIN